MARSLAPASFALAAIAVTIGCGTAARLGVTSSTARPIALTTPNLGAPAADSVAPTTAGPGRIGGAEPVAEGARKLAVPDLIGRSADEARALVKAAGFSQDMEVRDSLECDDAPREPDRINCQDPAAGALTNSYALIHIKVYRAQNLPANDIRNRIGSLRGLTLDEARHRLKDRGHDGKVIIRFKDNYDDHCGQDRVCDSSVRQLTSLHDDIALWVNRKLTIAPP
jgi:hypothetical protein